MKIYLAGPMTGIAEFNFPAFHAAAARLRALGHVVLNPADTDNGDTSKTWDYYMRKDLAMLLEVEAVAVLPGWRKSKGATLETHVAITLGLPILEASTLEPVTETCLEEAQRLVGGERGTDYGHPFEDFSRTGKMWAAILGLPDVTPEQVALCMAALKISRLCQSIKRDSYVDLAGYARTLELVDEHRRA